MEENKKYWKGIEDLNNTPSFLKNKEREFPEELPVGEFLENSGLEKSQTTRRDFLKFLGFSVAAVSLASCEAPIQKSIPYLVKPEEVTPGVANYYATNYYDGDDFCEILVKCREGRPIKIEGNPSAKITRGGTHARVQASLLSLYDSHRQKEPVINANDTDWETLDNEVISALSSASSIRILTPTIISPSTKKLLQEFKTSYPSTEVITYDAISYSGLLDAHKLLRQESNLPNFRFDLAKTIVSFNADFLLNWISPVQFASQYAEGRKPESENGMNEHIQIESVLSLTGSNADKRIALKPSEIDRFIAGLYQNIASRSGVQTEILKEEQFSKDIKEIAEKLWNQKGKSIVVSGSNDINQQILILKINEFLGNYGTTIENQKPCLLKQSDDKKLIQLVEDMKNEKVGCVIIWNCNPVYSLPKSLGFEEGLAKTPFSISISDRLDETALLCNVLATDHHYLESWSDVEPIKGYYGVSQPVIHPIFNTRQGQESILKWLKKDITFYDYIREYWQTELFQLQSETLDFENFWTKTLHTGYCELNDIPVIPVDADSIQPNTETSLHPLLEPKNLPNDAFNLLSKSVTEGATEIVFYQKAGIGSGRQANNPWLQELPDPVTKATWDNYITMSPKQMVERGFNIYQGQEEKADLVEITINGEKITLPVLSLPGQAYGSIGIALGYGRKNCGKTGDNIGSNVYTVMNAVDYLSYEYRGIQIGGSVGKYHLATTQTHHTMMGRQIVKEATLVEFKKNPKAGNPDITIPLKEGHHQENKKTDELDLWNKYEEVGQFWNLSIDLSSCIGCGNCVISCQAENNVAVVGKDEVRRGREMHWIRIDRYYSSDAKSGDYDNLEIPSENPSVVFQPVMCQHCNHAPCETVCPVIATSHSTDGLNQMTYNRCVGTRYCANNCPYKVRRFNWFNYPDNSEFDFNMNNPIGKLVLNPDVVVRTRGVMEKCSLCVQRIQETKLKSKMNRLPMGDGEVTTACAQSCPTKAITIGDINLKGSMITLHKNNPRSYRLLEEVGVKPNVFYMTKIRNKNSNEA
ncbi:MAG: TAT-variant-translocated molybdopterin oxidoreductase [Flavobacteriales bacterium]|nr:TAT-variant-translocated molybdopterin oxidoreductase [Flavobacteriales bacterium]